MKLYFKKRIFSWYDNFEVFDTEDKPILHVAGTADGSHVFSITDLDGVEYAFLQQSISKFLMLPRFEYYELENYVGKLKSKLSIFKMRYALRLDGWRITGDIPKTNYHIRKGDQMIAYVLDHELDGTTYTIFDIPNENDIPLVLLLHLSFESLKNPML